MLNRTFPTTLRQSQSQESRPSGHPTVRQHRDTGSGRELQGTGAEPSSVTENVKRLVPLNEIFERGQP
jgi:hypothetical protein